MPIWTQSNRSLLTAGSQRIRWPSVLCYGAHDKMQPFAASKPLVAALEKNGVNYRFFVAEHSGHGLQNDNKVYMEYLDAVVEYLDKYMKD